MINKRSKARMEKFLQERNEHPDRAAEIDAKIKKVFGEMLAVFVMDMSGFSRQTLRHGIIHFLSQIHRMHSIATPVVEGHGGEVIKYEADNIFAVFPEVEQAVEAAVELDRALELADTMLPEELDMHGEFGIGYGEILVIENDDIFGSEVNLASKLGEDLAQRGEILLTESAHARVEQGAREYERLNMSISGIELAVFKVRKDTKPAQAS
ncbi:MAG TPA: adenylate/guanylate cyclase domain-containing protein [Pyrinomonadaceae bacterium]|nr:adenylate/guanylate cyclase domain-containing protein [Pyrinomonadaceae bacterium]